MDEREALAELAQIAKPIKWVVPDSIRTDHATHLLVQQQGTEFTLLFFEVRSPIFTGTPEEQVASLHQLENIEAACVSRIVMSVEHVPLAATQFMEVVNNAIMQIKKGHENASD